MATFGDHEVSEKILNQIGYHLAPANLPPPGQTASPVQPAAATNPPQTPPPPLAPVPNAKP